MNQKLIYLLIGPKGSGKSFIGTLMDHAFGIHFIRVEDWAKAVKKDRQVDNPFYLAEVFQAIEHGVREVLQPYDQVVFESTGLSEYFDQMLQRLKKDFRLVTIGVQVSQEVCLQRVKDRDQSIHINVSDEQVNFINRQVQERAFQTDFILNNEHQSVDALEKELAAIVRSTTANIP